MKFIYLDLKTGYGGFMIQESEDGRGITDALLEQNKYLIERDKCENMKRSDISTLIVLEAAECHPKSMMTWKYIQEKTGAPAKIIYERGIMAEKEIVWYWVKINGEWSPAVKDESAAGGWTNLDTWEDFYHEVTEFVKIIPPPEIVIKMDVRLKD